MERSLKPSSHPTSARDDDPLRACVHCGLCLEACPTYRLTGDENNSPRGRLNLWRAEKEGRLAADPWTDFYTDECLGCLACESACPANVPYARLLDEARLTGVAQGRIQIEGRIRLAAKAVRYPRFFNFSLAPARVLRNIGLRFHSLVFPGTPAIAESTSAYAQKMMDRHRPTGPIIALLTGCLMEALFREINFATVRVLVENNVRVLVPENQGCCGALHEHTGLPGADNLFAHNREVFSRLKIDRVLTNSAGCGLALSKALQGTARVQDVLGFLGEIRLKARPKRTGPQKVYVDLPCHLIHGQGVEGIPPDVLDATGYNWELAPHARDCCGSGGVYNLQKPKNARQILQRKSAFLEGIHPDVLPILATSNHVCMMQWHSAHQFIRRPFQVSHVVQLLDPGSDF